MNTFNRLVFSLCIILIPAMADIDSALLEKMNQNPQEKHHIIAFLGERLQPEQVITEMNVRGDETTTARQLAQIFKARTNEQAHWLTKSYHNRVEKLFVHELSQAVSCVADARNIQALAGEPQVAKVCLFDEEKVKPHSCFLTDDYSQFRIRKSRKLNAPATAEEPVISVQTREGDEVSLDQIINTLKKIFDFIAENKPVVNNSVDMASAIPKGIGNWQELAGWNKTKSSQYILEYENGFGVTVVKFVYTIHFYANGNYQGKGRYITCATVSIDELSVLWGYTVNANVKIPDSGIVNIGTSSDPLAAMQVFVNWEVKTIIKHDQGTATYTLTGRGGVEEN